MATSIQTRSLIGNLQAHVTGNRLQGCLCLGYSSPERDLEESNLDTVEEEEELQLKLLLLFGSRNPIIDCWMGIKIVNWEEQLKLHYHLHPLLL